MSRVSFAGNTKTDSPARAYRQAAPLTSTKFDLQLHRGELRYNMHRKIVVCEHEKFFEQFMGSSAPRTYTNNLFAALETPTTESQMYDTLPNALNDSGLCPGYTFVATPHESHAADPTKQAVDCGMYKSKYVPQAADGSYARVDWSRMEISIECKAQCTEQDPFDPQAPDDQPTSEKRQEALGQILSYAELIFKHQQRTCHFMILFLGDFARLVRFDHSSIFATVKFNYKTDTRKLTDFLWRYSHQSVGKGGQDPTATRIEPNTTLWNSMLARKGSPESRATDHVQKLFDDSLDETWPWWQLEVQVAPPAGKRSTRSICTRRFAVGKPHFQAPGVTGRATRGYVALPIDSSGKVCGTFVYLKDAWRVDHKGIEKEGDTLYELNQAHVPYVPTLVCHGDLSGPEQTSDWRALWKEYYPNADDSECPLKRHQHYRLVVQEVGKPLTEFGPGSDELVFAISCVLQAHAAAYALGIIHRDISAGNILLYKDEDGDWNGLLNDWELSKRHDIEQGDGRQPDRTGTWQFMSAHALNSETRRIVLPDELESIFHVLLHIAVRFVPHNLPDVHVGQFLHDYFDDYCPHPTGLRCGSLKQSTMEDGVITGREVTPSPPEAALSRSSSPTSPWHSDTNSSFPEDDAPVRPQEKPPTLKRTHPLNDVVRELLSWFQAYYAFDTLESGAEEEAPVPEDSKVPSQSKRVQKMRRKAASRSTASLPSAAAAQSTSRPSMAAGVNVEELRALADNLSSHQPFINLIDRSLDQRWPQNDKTEDKKPKDGCVLRKTALPVASEPGTGSKKRQLLEQDARKDRAKRSKT
ncbi:hypothetical protein OH76DRAFT_1483228 [Lentinus brumalis]|uniref:Fungal-type protein kinase domain-containing protein n=1 Tax=Lentinus brumalis TaxID=2498619 RepID=A0A371D9R2_9APHY|nr:hypothetical protein OH76DRAFT_1483228 [Polyporus brumalis]